MVILLFGTRASETLLVIVTFICNYCDVAADQRVVRSVNRFTLFFVIPLFTLSTDHYVECSNCGGVTALTKEQAEHSLEWAARTRTADR